MSGSGSAVGRGTAPPTVTTRLALRAEFQCYFRVVIAFLGASAVRRNRQAGDASVSPLLQVYASR